MATEIGDKTFFIAAVLSMRNDRAAVFGGAILALVAMTVLSTLMGLVLPALMPRRYTHLIGGALFLYFGFKLLNDSRSMGDGVSEELEEVEEELAEMSKKRNRARRKGRVEEKKGMDDVDDDDGAREGADDNGPDDVEGGGGAMESGGDGSSNSGAKKRRGGGGGGAGLARSVTSGFSRASSSGASSTAGGYSGNSWESVFLQALTLTFLAEWGDRSQIATIALAAAKVRDAGRSRRERNDPAASGGPSRGIGRCPPPRRWSSLSFFALPRGRSRSSIFVRFSAARKINLSGSGRGHDRGVHGAQRLHGDGGRRGEDAGLAHIGEVRRVLRRADFFGLRRTLGILRGMIPPIS